MRQLWLHIGSPKTGSTSVQRYSRDRREYLYEKGIDFVVRRKRAAYNDLAIYLRGGDLEKATELADYIKARIAASDAEVFVISSEMFADVTAPQLRQLLQMDEPFDTKILGYFRRQDRYLESKYKQKMKTGKVGPGFENYVARFGIGAGNYLEMVNAWQAAFPDAEFVFRRFEPKRFPKGDVVRDFMSLFELDIDADEQLPLEDEANATPHIDLLDLMQIVAQIPELDARSVFRKMPIDALPRFRGRAMSNDAANQIMAHFEAENDALRQRYFPEDDALFDLSDLDGPEPEIAEPSFNDEQRVFVRELLKSVVANMERQNR